MSTLLVASDAGQLKQLERLLPRLGIEPERLWVTFDSPVARSMLEGEEVIFAPRKSQNEFRGAIGNLPFATALVRQVDFDRVVSTGANLATAFLPVARLLGSRTDYVESATYTDFHSPTANVLERIPGIHRYTQHRKLADPHWTYGGSIVDGLVPRFRSPREVRRLVVSLGTTEERPFPRLVSRLREIVPNNVDVIWQVGSTPAVDADAVHTLPSADLEQAMFDADAVICHAGVGAAVTAMEMGRLPLLVPRSAQLGESADDHQVATAAWFQARGLAMSVECDELTWEDIVTTAAWHIEQDFDIVAPFPLVP